MAKPVNQNVLQNPDTPINDETIRDTLERYDIETTNRTSPKRLAELLRKAYKDRIQKSKLPESEWLKCGECGEITDDDPELWCCPFCGDEGEEETDDDEEDEPDEIDDESDDDGDGPEDEIDDESDDDGDGPEDEIDDESDEPIETEDPDDDTEETEEPPVADLDDTDDAEEDETPPVKSTSAEVIPIGGKLASRPAVAAVVAIKKLESAIVSNWYQIATQIQAVYTSESWKLEGYDSFRDWSKKELGYSKTFVHSLIQAVRKFSEEDFASVSHSKLILIAGVDDDDKRQKLLDKAAAGATARDLKNEAQERGDAPPPENTPPKKAPKKPSQVITLIAKVNAKPKTHKFHDKDTGEQLKKWEKNAFVSVEISEGVVLYIALKTDRKGENIMGVTTMFKSEVEDDEAAVE